MAGNLTLPKLNDDEDDHRSLIENFVRENLLDRVDGALTVEKYYKSANEEIYNDCMTMVKSGIPGWFLRTTQIDTNEFSPEGQGDYNTCTIEIINVAPVMIEKELKNIDRYTYTMAVIARESLRNSFIKNLPNNRRRNFDYLGQRDIFRDDEVDIVLSEFNIDFVEL